MISFDYLEKNHLLLLERVARCCAACGRRPEEVRLLPVTKTHPPEKVTWAIRKGFAAVGENRVQEALSKMPLVSGSVQWELIGHLQSNKAALAAAHFGRIQSVDSPKLLHRLQEAAQQLGRTLPILLQCNAGEDPAKFGVSCKDAPALLESALLCPALRVEGLMTIAPLDSDLETAARCFARLRTLRDELSTSFGIPLKELSMGMSGDLEVALREGSTLLRVGSALFGQRD